MKRQSLIAAVAACLLLAGAAPASTQDTSAETYRQLDLFGEVFERTRANYVEEVSDEQLIEAAINGMLTALDPHSNFLNKEEFQAMQVQTTGEFGGLGIDVTMENGYVKVVSPIDDTPAARAGLEAGDYITHLNGTSVQGMTLQDAVDRMRGLVGTDITLTIVREGVEPFDVTLTRAIITVESVRWRVEDKIGYIRITIFNENTNDGLVRAVDAIEAELGDAVEGYVIDLRRNPGGLLGQAVAVADALLERGEIVSTRGRHDVDTRRYNATPGDITDGKPVVVLIDDGSASAAEIVAGALQDHGRALLLGTRSFGKGSVQSIMELAGNVAIRLTTARYYTPSGRSIQAVGITPDIVVEQAVIQPIERTEIHESDLAGALDNGAQEGDVTEPPPADAPPGDAAEATDQPADDYQLLRALDLLHGLALLTGRQEIN